MPRRSSALLAILLVVGMASAQTVYESKSSSGAKVFSDRPAPGSKPVELKPLNVVEPIPVSPQAAPAPAAAPAGERRDAPVVVRYKSFAITSPEPNGSVSANTATFEVRVAIDPPLQIEKGHAFVLRMDGRNVPGRYTATEMMVPPEFFGDVVPAGAQQHVMEAAVVDVDGAVVTSATPVSFQTRFVNVLQRPRVQPLPQPRPPMPPVPIAPAPRPGGSKAIETPAGEVLRGR